MTVYSLKCLHNNFSGWHFVHVENWKSSRVGYFYQNLHNHFNYWVTIIITKYNSLFNNFRPQCVLIRLGEGAGKLPVYVLISSIHHFQQNLQLPPLPLRASLCFTILSIHCYDFQPSVKSDSWRETDRCAIWRHQ